MDLLFEDVGYFDLTTTSLGISHKNGVMRFAAKEKIVVSGVNIVAKILSSLGADYTLHKANGNIVEAKELIIEARSNAGNLHKAWKISQNVLEYMSGIATYTSQMVALGRQISPHFQVATTRKNFPGAKALMVQAAVDGGGVVHRLGLFDSILIFKNHLAFLSDETDLKNSFYKLKKEQLEKKIAVEVENYNEARFFAGLGADILQCEKMNYETLKSCVKLKDHFSHLLVSATGGIDTSNVAEYAQCGVDFVVTSSSYHAKPADIKITIEKQDVL